MNASVRFVLFASAAATVAACVGTPAASSGAKRPTIELLARAVSYDASRVRGAAASAPVDVTLSLVGERLLDYASQESAVASKPGPLAAIAGFDPPSRHTCCWEPATLSLPSSSPVPASRIAIPAALDEEPASDVDIERGNASVQAAGVSLPTLEHVSLPASVLLTLSRDGVDVGSPAVAIVDIGDPAAPVVIGLRPADDRELASDPADPPTTADLPATLAPSTGHCARGTTRVPEHYARTLDALGPAFFHQPIATPRDVVRGTVSMSWAVLGSDHVRALFTSVARGCTQSVVVDISPAAHVTIPHALHRTPTDAGTLYGDAAGRRAVFVYDKIAYDVKGTTAYATSTFTRGLLKSSASAALVRTE